MEGTARSPGSHDAPLTHSAWAHFRGAELGVPIDFRGAELGVPIACAAFVASVQTHGRYFLMQQKSERDFVRWLPTLCDGVSSAAVEDREARYYSALNDRLRQLRASINRHVHAAFMVKAMCASVHEGRDVSRAINWTAARANKDSGSRAGEYASYAPLSFCNLPILDHEPYNIVEGFFVLNLTNHLLRTGAKVQPRRESPL